MKAKHSPLGKLILLPNLLGEEGVELLPSAVGGAVLQLDGLVAESDRAGRRFLDRFETKRPSREIPIALLEEDVDFLLEPVLEGQVWGVVSDAGLPCLADPGAKLVARARQKGVEVEALPGPSSLLLALMLCGYPAQRFRFLGYWGRERSMEVLEVGETVAFIEAPYRNQVTLEALVAGLRPDTRLGVAVDLTQPTQEMITGTIDWWRKRELPEINRRPAVFLVWSMERRRERTSPKDSRRPCRDSPKRRGRR